MSIHSFVIFSVSVCETEASYSLPEFIFSSLYLMPFLTVSVNLLLHKPFPYSGIFNIILILSSTVQKKGKTFFKLLAFWKWCLVFSPSLLNVKPKSWLLFFCPFLFQWSFFWPQPWHRYLAPFWKFLLSCHCFLVLFFDYFSPLDIHLPSAN